MWIKEASLLLVLCTTQIRICSSASQDVDVRLDELQAQVLELKDEVTELTRMVGNQDLESMVKHNIADQKLDKAVASLLMNKQGLADTYWDEVSNLITTPMQKTYLKRLVENTYLGNSDNFYYILDFVTRNELYSIGYPMLYKELEMHGELTNGQEIFALAHQAKSLCGTKTTFYMGMPRIIKQILGGPVILKNVENDGYMIVDEGYTMCSTRRDCYEDASSQVHIYRPQLMTMQQLQSNSRAHWQFVGPENNVTALAEGFFIKNPDRNLYFVFKQRPGGTFLRSNLTFDSYYARDFHAQFEPSLVPNAPADSLLLLIGVRERFFKKISYFKSSEFVKRQNKAAFSRLPLFQRNVTGYVWEAIPVDSADEVIDNTIDDNDKCNFIM